MTDFLAPGVVRVGTDTDHTPIGTCWGDDLPAGWLWRMDKDENEWVDSELDNPPSGTWWVQCRPPATSPTADNEWTVQGTYVHGPGQRIACVGMSGRQSVALAERVADALNAAESQAAICDPQERQP